jgi:hypothetical protein
MIAGNNGFIISLGGFKLRRVGICNALCLFVLLMPTVVFVLCLVSFVLGLFRAPYLGLALPTWLGSTLMLFVVLFMVV